MSLEHGLGLCRDYGKAGGLGPLFVTVTQRGSLPTTGLPMELEHRLF